MQEVAEWRAESKSEAKQIGLRSNKAAVVLPINWRSDAVKDPRSSAQALQWDAPKANHIDHLAGQPLSLVVDLMEGRKIGAEELPAGMCNYVAMKLEVIKSVRNRNRIVSQVDKRWEPMYTAFSESRGSSHTCWIDSFHMTSFPIRSRLVTQPPSHPSLRLTIKHGTLENPNYNPLTNPSLVFEACLSKEIIVNLTPKSAAGKGFQNLEPVILKPTWYQWRNARGANNHAFIKIMAQLVETAKIPSVEDFLPYTEWPPMVLHTKKSRIDLMIEEQETAEEEMFEGKLGDQLISYNPATLPRILGVFAGDYNRDFLLAFGLVMGGSLIDRTGTLAVAKYDFTSDPVDPGRRSIHLSLTLSLTIVLRLILTERKLNLANMYPVPPMQVNQVLRFISSNFF